MAALVLGGNVTHTAAELGVDRRTIQRWMKNDPQFQEVLAAMRQELVVCTRQHLLALAETSVEMVEKTFRERPSPTVALKYLQAFGVLGPEARQKMYTPPHVDPEVLEILADEKKDDASESATSDGEEPGGESKPFSLQSIRAEEAPPLLPEQQAVMASLAQGETIADAAASARVRESEVRHWLHTHVEFGLQLSELQFQRLLAVRGQILGLMRRATEIVRAAIQGGNARIALSLFRGLGMTR